MKRERNYGLDLIRIIAMLGIIESHLLAHGGVLTAAKESANGAFIIVGFLNTLCFWPVDAYALCTGIAGYQGRHKLTRLISVHLETIFYSFGISVVFFLLQKCTLKQTIRSLFPLLGGQYWYFTAYFFSFMLMPFLDTLVDIADNRQLAVILTTLCIINAFSFSGDCFRMGFGLSGLWLIILYVIGAMIRKHHLADRIKTKYLFTVMLVGVLTAFVGGWVIPELTERYAGIVQGEKQFLKFTAPSVLITAITLVMFFQKMQITNKNMIRIIKLFSPLTYGVFLIHEHSIFVDNIYRDKLSFLVTYFNPIIAAAILILLGIALFLFCAGIDYFRTLLFRLLGTERFSETISERIMESFRMIETNTGKSGNVK